MNAARIGKSLTMPAWSTLKAALKQFQEDELADRAAALTYYGVLALFPGLIVLVALLGLLGQYPQTSNALLEIVGKVSPGSTVDTVREPINEVVRSKGGAGALVGIGLLVALWAASGYVGAFMRAANSIYDVKEGRPFWKLRPLQVALTLAMVLLVTVLAVGLVATGPVAKAIGDVIGLGQTAVDVWNVAKWPVLVAMVMLTCAALYHAAPNVRPQRFRLVTRGSAVAVVVWILASVGFAVYVANFGSYGATYGSLGAVIVFLVWLWIGNLALLLGVEIDGQAGRRMTIGSAPSGVGPTERLRTAGSPRNAPTTAESNCVPLPASSSPRASSGESAPR
jgi:membrane protein